MTRRRLPLLALAPVFALVALLAWAFASPVGAGPDDDYHLISAWCAGPTAAETCAPVDGEPGARMLPEGLVEVSCYARDAGQSAACQDRYLDGDLLDDLVVSDRGNFVGEYPPVYYAVLGMFTSLDVQASALTMRAFTIALFVGILTALFLLLPRERRPTLLIGWLVTTVPLGVFLLASNNPSAWAMIGVGTSWLALLGYFETRGRRRIALAVLYALGVLMAAGSRGDAALYVGFATVLVLAYTFRHERRFYLSAILPVGMGLVALAFFLTSGQVGSGLGGFSSAEAAAVADEETPTLTGTAQLFYNALNIPLLWAGAFGEWGLGWLDTALPAVVLFCALGAAIVAGVHGLRRMSRRKGLIVGAAGIVLWLLPLYVLQQGGALVGEQVQPRYILPLIVLFGGLLALGTPIAAWTRGQLVAVAAALAVANLVALRVNILRYVRDADRSPGGLSLDRDLQWWWELPLSPTAVWVVGSLAYAGLALVIALALSRPLAVADRPGVRRLP